MSNRSGPTVRKRADDARVVRTRRALGDALVELMHAHSFDGISVQQVLERANVGRATFYAHFRGKHDLLLSDAERFFDFLERSFIERAAGTRRIAPVAELFEHIGGHRQLHDAIARSDMREPIYDLLTGHLARIAGRRLETLAGDVDASSVVTSRTIAALVVEMLRWWLERGAQPSAQEMDDRLHDVVWNGLASVATTHASRTTQSSD